MHKRDLILSLTGSEPPAYTPAAFFLHFDPAYHSGLAAVNKHLEFYRATGMDLVKVQYEQRLPPTAPPERPADWANAPIFPADFFEAPVAVARGLVEAAHNEALVIMTLYSPFMWAKRWAGEAVLEAHLREDPEAVRRGLDRLTENVLALVRGCQAAGVDGFYASSQGGEARRFSGTDIFARTIKPTDLRVWDQVQASPFNILHVCDYEGGYDDLTPFLDYPGQVVNCSLTVGGRELSPREAAALFGRPFMGGLERKGVIATGSADAIRQAVEGVLADAPERLMLAADCTVPGETPWENLRTAIETAHAYRR